MDAPTALIKSVIGWLTVTGYSENMIAIDIERVHIGGIVHRVHARCYRTDALGWSFSREQGALDEIYIDRVDGGQTTPKAAARIKRSIEADMFFWIMSSAARDFKAKARLYGLDTQIILAAWEIYCLGVRMKEAQARYAELVAAA